MLRSVFVLMVDVGDGTYLIHKKDSICCSLSFIISFSNEILFWVCRYITLFGEGFVEIFK